MKRLLTLCSTVFITATLSMPVQAKESYGENAYDDDVWIVLYYAAVVDQDPIAEFYLANPDAEGATEYGEYCYYSYSGSKGGSYKQSSSDSSARD